MKIAWQENLARYLGQRPVLIVHGNVRDRYVDGMREFTSLRPLLASRVTDLAAADGMTASICVYDWVRGRRMVDRDGLDRGDYFAGQAPPTTIDQLEVDLAETGDWLAGTHGATEAGSTRTAIVEYADLIVPYQSSYADAQRHLLIRLEKLLADVDLPHRIVLVALEDSWLPPHLYVQAPHVATLRIPTPGQDERLTFIRRRLDEAGAAGRVPADLDEATARMTTGLYLRELREVVARMLREEVESEQDARAVLAEWRTGAKESPWLKLPLDRLSRAPQWFAGETPDADGAVVGQREAIERVSRSLWVARAGLSGLARGHEQRPKIVLLFAGPTGVGKTELAKRLAAFVFGDKDALIRFDMSEFKGDFTISRLIGAPPGYVGHEQGGQLTTQVRERPFSILLFDEIEKADPQILDIFLQILDDGRLSDSRGQTVFFGETAVIFTSNVGARDNKDEGPMLAALMKQHALDPEACKRAVREHFERCVQRFFATEIGRPELLNRIRNGIVPFNPILEADVRAVIAERSLQTMEAAFRSRFRGQGRSLRISRQLGAYMVGGWAYCPNDECQVVVLAGSTPAASCPSCGAALGEQDLRSGSEGNFGGRGVADDIDDALSFELARAVLRWEAAHGGDPVQFTIGTRSVGGDGLAVLDITSASRVGVQK